MIGDTVTAHGSRSVTKATKISKTTKRFFVVFVFFVPFVPERVGAFRRD